MNSQRIPIRLFGMVDDRDRLKPEIISDSEHDPNPLWFKIVMFGFMILGLAWILVFYISSARYPLGVAVPGLNIGNWNILVGFGIAMIGFMMTTRWK